MGFHLTCLYFFLRTRQRPPDMSILLVEISFLDQILNKLFGVFGPSAGIIYTLGHISTNSESSKSVMARDHNLVREDTPELAQPSKPSRWSRFADFPYAADGFHPQCSTLGLGISINFFKFPPWSN